MIKKGQRLRTRLLRSLSRCLCTCAGDDMHNDDDLIFPIPSSQPAKQPVQPAADVTRQAITGLTPPEVREALIRECRPTVSANGRLAGLARWLMRTVIGAPLGWLVLAPLFALKFAPFLSRRYRLTNRRLAICHGLRTTVVKEILLADIDEVRLDPASIDAFYLAGTLEIVSDGEVRLRLPAVPEPEGFRQAILNACSAWVPRKARTFHIFLPANSEGSGRKDEG